MKEPVWLTTELVKDVHAEQLAVFGGPAGIRDEGLLESAIGRPRNRFAYESVDMADLAASYAFGIARNHPFVDGNKRAAFASIIVFLGLNDVEFKASPSNATAAILALAAGEIDEVRLAGWIRDNMAST